MRPSPSRRNIDMWRLSLVVLAALVVFIPSPVPACSLCQGQIQNTLTLRQEAGLSSARIIVFGSVQNSDPKLGTSDVRILDVLRSDPFLGNAKKIELPRFVPVVDEKDKP